MYRAHPRILRLVQSFCLEIGGFKTGIEADFDQPLLKLPLAYKEFLVSPKGINDLNLEVVYGKLPSLEGFPLLYDTQGSWALYKDHDFYWYRRPSPISGKAWSLLRLEKDRKNVTLIVGKKGNYTHKNLHFFVHPLDNLLFFYWTSFYPALIVHACGIGTGDFGYAFLGHSGFGKSTLTRLFKKFRSHTRLSDDRLMIASQEKGWRLFGTPWHGDANVFSKASFPLKKIIFLKHGKQNQLTPVSPTFAAAKIFAMSFPVLWDKEKMGHALSVASKIAQEIPAFEFAFLPDPSAIEYLEKNLF